MLFIYRPKYVEDCLLMNIQSGIQDLGAFRMERHVVKSPAAYISHVSLIVASSRLTILRAMG